MTRIWVRSLAVGLAIAAGAVSAQAQTFPTKPVNFIVPFAPGGTTDILARLVGQNLEQRLGKPFIIENRPGAGSVTAATAVARAPADGYTLMMAATVTMSINPSLYKKLPYDPAADLIPIAHLVSTPFVLVVNPSLPVHSVQDLVRLAKEKPGQLSFASTGQGTPHHLYSELLKTMTGIELTHVPYRGSVPALSDIVAGHVQLMFVDIAPALGLIAEGKVRALGLSSKDRLPAIADVPPVADAVPGFDAASWQMVIAPAGTPAPVVERLHTEIKSILGQADTKEKIVKMGMMPVDTASVADLQRFIKSETERWAVVLQKAGIAGSQ